MKKTLLLLAILLQTMLLFGQKNGEGATNWGPWSKAAPCFPNLYFSFKCLGWVSSVNKYAYNFRLKNIGNKVIHFNLDLRFSSGENYTADGRFDLSPGQEYTHVSMYYNTKPVPNATNFILSYVTKYVENNGRDDWSVPSYTCDGNRQVCDANCNSNKPSASNSQTNTNNSSSNTSYDPTFDRNNASFQDYYKRATAAGQAGNYDQAISLWNSAISVAVNDAQRNNAKAWLAEAQKAKASSVSTNNYQQQQIAQQQAQQQALLKQQQALQKQQQLQQGITQLADGITGLVASIQANKEKKRLEEQQRALAAKQKALEEEMANSKALVDAENGDFSAQRKVADKAFADSEYGKAENYYALAIQNDGSDKNQKASMLEDYLSSLALQGKRKEYFYIINDLKKEKNSFTYSHNLLLALSQIFCSDFPSESMDCNDDNISDGVKKLTTITWGIAPVVVNYLQATGLYTQYGISADAKTAFEALEKRAERKYPEKAALYYLGMIYLNGTANIKANDRKALKYFTDAINYDTKDIGRAPTFSTNNGQGYFNYRLLAYVKIAQILSRKSDKDDLEMSKRMLRSFYKWYKPMIPNADLPYFKEFETK